ncbi:Smr/MutS family protein [Spirochaeta lutea]|uniref:Smr/MutS family protein n=1 Tax=Spirochaeta lutea TaxID=1480694 RepID=UPI0006924C13|nr:Smr/MutS family protein [Spirochaeta lutea]
MSSSNFDEILETWEHMRRRKPLRSEASGGGMGGGQSNHPKHPPKKAPRFEDALDSYLPDTPKDADYRLGEGRALRPDDMPVEDTLDLHGFTVEEAEGLVSAFLRRCQSQGMGKVLIIHGKGNHSTHGGVLRIWLHQFLETWKAAGARGYATRREGGSGATWVILKRQRR